jgi:hypothetical protein
MGASVGDFQSLDSVQGNVDHDVGNVDVQFVSHRSVFTPSSFLLFFGPRGGAS